MKPDVMQIIFTNWLHIGDKMIIGFWIIGAILVIYGIYRICKGHKAEGIGELIGGIFELIFEIIGALL